MLCTRKKTRREKVEKTMIEQRLPGHEHPEEEEDHLSRALTKGLNKINII
jgi:hypothetical protein